MTARIASVALLIVAVSAFAITAGGDDDRYRLRVQMHDAAGLRKDFVVKVAGAPVGKVSDVTLDRADHAVAVLELDKAAAPVGRDARAAIRASNLLGEKYVDLTPGDVSRPAPSGFEIPRWRTKTPSDLDDVLSVLDDDTRVALGAFLVNQGDALVGRGGDLAAALTRIPPTLDAAQQLLAGLAHNNRALGSLVERSDRVLATVTPQRRALGRLVGSAGGALQTLDGRRAALGRTIERAPGAVRQLRTTLGELQDAARPLSPAARGLRATAPALTGTLRALPEFADAARPTLQTARSVAPALRRLGREAEPVVRRLAPAGPALRTFATSLEPVTELLDVGIADTLGVMQGWARSIQNRDNVGHVFRVSAELGGDVLNALNDYIKTPARTGPRRPARAPSKAPEGGAPSVQLPKVTVPKLPLPEPKLPDDATDTPAGASVDDLLDFLLKP